MGNEQAKEVGYRPNREILNFIFMVQLLTHFIVVGLKNGAWWKGQPAGAETCIDLQFNRCTSALAYKTALLAMS